MTISRRSGSLRRASRWSPSGAQRHSRTLRAITIAAATVPSRAIWLSARTSTSTRPAPPPRAPPPARAGRCAPERAPAGRRSRSFAQGPLEGRVGSAADQPEAPLLDSGVLPHRAARALDRDRGARFDRVGVAPGRDRREGDARTAVLGGQLDRPPV